MLSTFLSFLPQQDHHDFLVGFGLFLLPEPTLLEDSAGGLPMRGVPKRGVRSLKKKKKDSSELPEIADTM